MKNKKYYEEFYKTFGIYLKHFLDPISGFDIIKFDEYLKNKYGDYEDGETSMEDFVEKTFGKDAVALIRKLIDDSMSFFR